MRIITFLTKRSFPGKNEEKEMKTKIKILRDAHGNAVKIVKIKC